MPTDPFSTATSPTSPTSAELAWSRGGITAALFLEEFVDGTPWAHIDIAGTAQADPPGSWRPRGCTGFGARLLPELALSFNQ